MEKINLHCAYTNFVFFLTQCKFKRWYICQISFSTFRICFLSIQCLISRYPSKVNSFKTTSQSADDVRERFYRLPPCHLLPEKQSLETHFHITFSFVKLNHSVAESRKYSMLSFSVCNSEIREINLDGRFILLASFDHHSEHCSVQKCLRELQSSSSVEFDRAQSKIYLSEQRGEMFMSNETHSLMMSRKNW